MKKMINTERVEGRIYQHNLVIKTVQNRESANFGKEFISGNIEVATDEAGLNIIPVHFTYVTETTGSGNTNATYSNLKKIIETGKTWITDGPEAATKVRIDTALALNDFYTEDDRQISTKVNEGGFVTILNGELNPENERNTFTTDMVITNVSRVEADPEKNIDKDKFNIINTEFKNDKHFLRFSPKELDNIDKDYLIVKGCVFNFRNNILPVDYVVKNEDGMQYFEDLNASPNEPVFTKVWGKINCTSIVNEIKEETAFGEESVRTFERITKEWLITGTSKVPYDFGDESVLTVAELTAAMQDRELLLADTKKRSQDYRASKKANSATIITPTAVVNTPVQVVNKKFDF